MSKDTPPTFNPKILKWPASKFPFTVLMSVYHRENPNYFRACLLSLKQQTLPATQVIVIRDGPITDELEAVISDFHSILPIKAYTLPKNEGLATALNFGLEKCSNEVVARVDTDDICCIDRFEKQIPTMHSNPHISVLSSTVAVYDEKMETLLYLRQGPYIHSEISKRLLTKNCISHPAVCFRKTHVLELGGYPNQYPEDWALWIKLLNNGQKFHSMKETLVKMRAGDALLKRRNFKFFKGEAKTLKMIYDLGLISKRKFIFNCFIRLLIRITPITLKKIAYRYAHKT